MAGIGRVDVSEIQRGRAQVLRASRRVQPNINKFLMNTGHAAEAAMKEAAGHYVYDIPQSGLSDYERTTNLYNSIKAREIPRGWEVYIDEEVANRDGFIYPEIVDTGTDNLFNRGIYMYARHFWEYGGEKAKMLGYLEFAITGEIIIKEIKNA
jgi:hypothetical protein